MGASQSELESFSDPGPTVTEERFLRIVKTVEGTDDVIVENIMEKHGSELGDGMASDIQDVRVEANVKGVKRKYSWMVKSTPRTADRAVTLMKMRVDEREVTFFKDLLPKLKNFSDRRGKSHLVPAFCHVPFCAWNEKDKVLVMQNLKLEGYRDAINKKKGLDYDHMKLAFKWLAQFHALGFAFLDQYKGGIQQAKEDLEIFFFKILELPHSDDMLESYGKFQDPVTMNVMEQVDEKYGGTKYVDAMKALFEKHGGLFKPALIAKEMTQFKILTLCHSDPWFNNLMFRYSGDKTPVDVLFIDLQAVSVLGPATDLTYLLYSSTTKQFRDQHLEELLRLYHNILITNINQLGSIVDYTYEDLVKELNMVGLWGLNLAVGLGDMLADKEDMINVDDMYKAFANPHSEESKEFLAKHEATKKAALMKTGLADRLKDIVDECIKNGTM